MGIWHGNNIKYVIGEGLWFWAVLVLSRALKSPLSVAGRFVSVRTGKFIYSLFQMCRTFVIVSVGLVFFRADSLVQALGMLRNGMHVCTGDLMVNLRVDGLTRSSFSGKTGIFIFLCACVLFIYSEILGYRRHIDFSSYIGSRPLWVKWFLYWGIVIMIALHLFMTPAPFIYEVF